MENGIMNRISVNVQQGNIRVNRHIYGSFSEHLGRCIYGGFWVGNDPDTAASIPNLRGIRKDIVAALRHIKIPNLRWPGGCFADEYHWKDGIGTQKERPRMINTHWGGVSEDNSFGTHEFIDLCEQLGCEPYICGNVGSGTVQELSQWIEYCNFDGVSPMAELRAKNGREKPFNVKFWGIGNENWGCGGMMTPEYYADLFRRYGIYARNYGSNNLYKIACGPSRDDYNWTEVMMRKTYMKGHPRNQLHGLALHYYTVPGEAPGRGSATLFGEGEWFVTMKKAYMMDELVHGHGAIMDKYDPDRQVGLVVDEWGTWYDVEPGTNPGFLYQQNTLRDALVAGLHLNIFNNYAERIRIANIAQTVNVLQSVILTEGRNMVLTPTYHVFDLYKVHQGAAKLPVYVECENYDMGRGVIPAISASATMDLDDKIHISLCNIDPKKDQKLLIELNGYAPKFVNGRIITSGNMQDYNSFTDPGKISVKEFNDAVISGRQAVVTIPSKSVVTLEIV
jgi:alpha-N-arabinofuranosidase